jgi:hypothetical protein
VDVRIDALEEGYVRGALHDCVDILHRPVFGFLSEELDCRLSKSTLCTRAY